jgi:formiminotetrahydrofolate cyclodeaminase
MLEEMSSSEVADWMAYERLEPWGEERADLRTGILASLVANVTRGKDQKPYGPAEFMPDFEPKEESDGAKTEQQDLISKAMSVFGMFRKAPK